MSDRCLCALQVYKTYKQNELLKGVTWECKKGDRVGLVGVNGAGKTTQLQIVMGNVEPDSGEVLKSRRNLQVAYLNQEFDINPDRTVREELASAFAEGMAVAERTEEIQKELETCTDDMDKMSALLDELDKLGNKAEDLDMATIDKRLDKMMPELGFKDEDNDRCASLAVLVVLSCCKSRNSCRSMLSARSGVCRCSWTSRLVVHFNLHVAFIGVASSIALTCADLRYPARCNVRRVGVRVHAGRCASIRAGGRCACVWARSCCKTRMCYYLMSLPTISTWTPSSGSRATSSRSRCPL